MRHFSSIMRAKNHLSSQMTGYFINHTKISEKLVPKSLSWSLQNLSWTMTSSELKKQKKLILSNGKRDLIL